MDNRYRQTLKINSPFANEMTQLNDSELSLRNDTIENQESGVTAIDAHLNDIEEELNFNIDVGWSTVAKKAIKTYKRKQRPTKWRGKVFGLVVHTTGGSLPGKAISKGIDPLEFAANYYYNSHGCHYVNGWGGIENGQLVQVANEIYQANGVGMQAQRKSVENRRFSRDLSLRTYELWRAKWPEYQNPMQLLPEKETYANGCFVHLECIPIRYYVKHRGGKSETRYAQTPPLKEGILFTKAQHDAVAELAVDIAKRNNWPANIKWWKTNRLLGHEDLSPISRHNSSGGWDPGALRDRPFFDWQYVYDKIEEIINPSIIGSFSKKIQIVTSKIGTMAKGSANTAIVINAIKDGVTDVNQLTNLLFYKQFPRMDGKKISKDDHSMIAKWLEIREKVIKPTLSKYKYIGIRHEFIDSV